jgi:hypothetical protein
MTAIPEFLRPMNTLQGLALVSAQEWQLAKLQQVANVRVRPRLFLQYRPPQPDPFLKECYMKQLQYEELVKRRQARNRYPCSEPLKRAKKRRVRKVLEKCRAATATAEEEEDWMTLSFPAPSSTSSSFTDELSPTWEQEVEEAEEWEWHQWRVFQ